MGYSAAAMRRLRLVSCLLAVALVPRPAAGSAAAGSPACGLRDVAGEAGLAFVHERGSSPRKHLAETMGAGVAWLDYDGDGWQDLYVVQSGPFPPDGPPDGSAGAANRLFRNLGPDRDGALRFEDVTDRAGVGDRGYGMGATAADADGDGDVDLYVTNFGPDVFYRNRGPSQEGASFEDATEAAGLATAGWSSSAAFADADGDGDLDLYVTRYVEFPAGSAEHDPFCGDPETGERRYCDPAMFEGSNDVFYRNLSAGGDSLAFEDATAAAGLAGANGRGLGVLFTDLDGDGAPDVYVANDETMNFLFRGRGDGTFEDLSLLSGTAVNADGKPEAGMGLVAADFDTDGDPDLAVTNFDVETNTYYENLTESPGALQFADRSAPNGFGVPSFNFLGFGMVPADLDGDGDLDVYVANGHIFERPGRPEIGYAQRDQVLLGDGRGRFAEVRCPVLAESPQVGRGLAAADPDRDGDPDLAVTNNGGPLQLLASDLPGLGGGALAVELPAASAVGARVTLVVESGGDAPERRHRWVTAGDSYQSASAPTVLFALGDGETARALEIRWPDGSVTRIDDPPMDRYLRIDP